jgi:hypothetical protein
MAIGRGKRAIRIGLAVGSHKRQPFAKPGWASAREAYTAAAALGSYAPETFRHLAITYEHFGDHADAVAPARHAVELDRFDPVSQALLTKLTGH